MPATIWSSGPSSACGWPIPHNYPVFGADAGKIWIADDFDDTPEDMIRAFEGEEGDLE